MHATVAGNDTSLNIKHKHNVLFLGIRLQDTNIKAGSAFGPISSAHVKVFWQGFLSRNNLPQILNIVDSYYVSARTPTGPRPAHIDT